MEWVIIWVLFGLLAAGVASSRGSSSIGWFIAGIFLGPFALIAAFVDSGRQCPECRSRIHRQAKRCPKCQVPLTPAGKPEAQGCPWCYRMLSADERWAECRHCARPLAWTDDGLVNRGSAVEPEIPKARVATPPPWENPRG